MTLPRDAFDDALERMHNAIRTAHAAFEDAEAALVISLQALHEVTREKGSLRETVDRLEHLIMSQGEQLRELRERLNGHTPPTTE